MRVEEVQAMGREIEVVYEDGVFKPTEPVRLENGARLRLYIPYEPNGMTPEKWDEFTRETHRIFGEVSDEDWAEIEKSWKRSRG
jgi:predicted DNA-binding antitoxin AbrB/MazE fold protein